MSTTMKFDPQGNLELNWPSSDLEIIELGTAFVTYEEAQPVAQQLKDLPVVFFSALVKQAQDSAAQASAGEASRAQAAEAVRQAMEQARPLLDKVILHLKSRQANNLAGLEQWGLTTNATARGVSVIKPKNETEWRAFLLSYTEKEATLPVADQITDPPLSQLQALAETVRQNRADRMEQTTRRTRNVAARTSASQKLLDALQAAAAVLIVTRFGGQLTRDLQAWGYRIVAKTAKATATPPEETPAA
jgi:hypothetical protein